jgi:uncharacterized repeat protein (TIGR01451 family)
VLGGTEGAYFDNVRVEWPLTGTNTIAGGTPPNIATNWTLRPGQILTATFQVLVDNPVAVTQIINTAYSSSRSQLLPISDTITNSVSAADLAVTKTVNNANPNAGSNVVYTITITNNGPLTASSVAVTERLTNGLAYISHSASRGTYTTNTGIWSVGVLTNRHRRHPHHHGPRQHQRALRRGHAHQHLHDHRLQPGRHRPRQQHRPRRSSRSVRPTCRSPRRSTTTRPCWAPTSPTRCWSPTPAPARPRA